MTGYGDEDNNFVIELTYNYGIRSYERGNDYNFIQIRSNQAISNIKERNYPFKLDANNLHEVVDPNGYTFLIGPSEKESANQVIGLSLFISDLHKSADYWINQLKFSRNALSDSDLVKIEISFNEFNFTLTLVKSDQAKIDHAKAYGRIAFSCPTSELKPLQAQMEEQHLTILTPYIQLDTPGKASVCVVILADPDGHEICFVGDEGFRQLSQVDPKAHVLLDDAIKNDKSDEWHEKKKLKGLNAKN